MDSHVAVESIVFKHDMAALDVFQEDWALGGEIVSQDLTLQRRLKII